MIFATQGLQCWDTGQVGAEFETLEPRSLLQLCCYSGRCHSSLERRPKQYVLGLLKCISQVSSLLPNKLGEGCNNRATYTGDTPSASLLLNHIK